MRDGNDSPPQPFGFPLPLATRHLSRVSWFSSEQYPYFFERVQVRAEFDSRARRKTVVRRVYINDFPYWNLFRVNTADTAGDHALASFQIGVRRQIAQFNQRAVQRARRSDDPMVAGLVLDEGRDAAVGVAQQDH